MGRTLLAIALIFLHALTLGAQTTRALTVTWDPVAAGGGYIVALKSGDCLPTVHEVGWEKRAVVFGGPLPYRQFVDVNGIWQELFAAAQAQQFTFSDVSRDKPYCAGVVNYSWDDVTPYAESEMVTATIAAETTEPEQPPVTPIINPTLVTFNQEQFDSVESFRVEALPEGATNGPTIEVQKAQVTLVPSTTPQEYQIDIKALVGQLPADAMQYTVRIAAFNTAGSVGFSDPSPEKLVRQVPPPKPTNVHIKKD